MVVDKYCWLKFNVGFVVFKVYLIEEDKFKEVCNLRASKHLNLSFSCNDVAWSTTDGMFINNANTNQGLQ